MTNDRHPHRDSDPGIRHPRSHRLHGRHTATRIQPQPRTPQTHPAARGVHPATGAVTMDYHDALHMAGYDDPPPSLYVDTRKPPRWYRAAAFTAQLAALTLLAAAATLIGIAITWTIANIINAL